MLKPPIPVAVATLCVLLAGCGEASPPEVSPAGSSPGDSPAPSAGSETTSAKNVGALPPFLASVAAEKKLEQASIDRVVATLKAIEGVESVDFDAERSRASVVAGRYLYEHEVRSALEGASFELGEFTPPEEALVPVYVVDAAGGG